MTSAELFGEGINLMFSGMGFVLVFLLILIWALDSCLNLSTAFFPNLSPHPKRLQILPHFLRHLLTILSVCAL